MKMFSATLEKVSLFLLKRKTRRYAGEPRNFNTLFSGTVDYLVILPEDESEFRQTFSVLKELKKENKSITLFLLDYYINLLPSGEKYRILQYSKEDVNRLKIPIRQLQTRLADMSYDLVIDLNTSGALFPVAVANYVQAKFRAGFQKSGYDMFYNFQVSSVEGNPEKSYRKLLNSLKMF